MAKGINRSIRIFVNNKEVEHSLRNVRNEMNRLRREAEGLPKGTAKYIEKSRELQKVSAYYREIRQEITGLPGYFDKLTESAKGIVAILGVGFGLHAVIGRLRQIVDISIELSKAQTDLRRSLGLSRKEVGELTDELKELDTTTSTLDLMKMAEEAGRFGVARENIASFVVEMDKANVVLGEGMGGVEGLTTSLVQLREGYRELDQMSPEQTINKVGSAIHALTNESIASEKNITAFAVRLGNLPASIRPTVAEALAMGAAFEEAGIDATRASRAYNVLLESAVKETGKYAKLMGQSREEITKLINTNPTEFFLQFSKALSDADRSGTGTVTMFKELGLSSNAIKRVFGVAAEGSDRFRAVLERGNQALDEGIALTEDYNIVNEGLADSVERIKKHFIELIESDRVVAFVQGLVDWFSRLLGVTDENDKKLGVFGETMLFAVKALAVLVAGMVSYQAAMKLNVLWTKRHTESVLLNNAVSKQATLLQKLYTAALMLGAAATNLATGNTKRATAALRVFNMTLRSNPLGLFLAALAAVITAVTIFRNKTKEAADRQKEFGQAIREAHKTAVEETGKTIGKIDQLISVIKDEAISIEIRKRAYQELIKIAPEFNGLLVEEKFNIEELTRVYSRYVTQLQNVAKAKATRKIVEDTAADVTKGEMELFQVEKEIAAVRAEMERLKKEGEAFEKMPVFARNSGKIVGWTDEETSAYREQTRALRELLNEKEEMLATQELNQKNAELAKDFSTEEARRITEAIQVQQNIIDAYEDRTEKTFVDIVARARQNIKNLNAELAAMGLGSTDDGAQKTPTPTLGSGGDNKERDRRLKVAEELVKIELQKNRQLRDLELQNEKERVQLMEDGWQKRAQLLDIERREKLNKLRDELEDLQLLRESYERRAAEEAGKGNTLGAEGFRKQAEEVERIEQEKSETLVFIEQTHQQKLQSLKLEMLKKQSDDRQAAFDRELRNLDTLHNEELKAVVDLESAKQALRERYGYSDEELAKLKSFEKAKAQIVLEQQSAVATTQADQLRTQISELQNVLNADDAFEGTVWGRMFDEQQRDEILQWIEVLQNKLSEIQDPDRGAADTAAENAKLSSFIDVLGFSADQWQEVFDNLDKMSARVQLVQMAAQAMSNVWSQFYSMQQANMRRDFDYFAASVDRKKEALSKQLEDGIISQAGYNAKVAKMDEELEKKRAEMEFRQAIAEWRMSLLQAAVNTSVGITSALAMSPPNFVIAGIVGAMGAVQAGLIAANRPDKPAGYAAGGPTRGTGIRDSYGNELADGPYHADEYVIPKWLRQDPQIARMEEFIEARRTGYTRSMPESSGYKSGGITRPQSSVETEAGPASESNTDGMLRDIRSLLRHLTENPIEAKLTRTMETAKRMNDDINDYTKHRNKNKR